MTEAAFINILREVPVAKQQELYDFARFLANNFSDNSARIAAFESEDEMIDFINDVGASVYAA